MPDQRKHRGPHPEDARLFAPALAPTLQKAAADLDWLLSRGYPHKSSLKLVGDRDTLVSRQRIAVGRCACGDEEASAAPWRSSRPLTWHSYDVCLNLTRRNRRDHIRDVTHIKPSEVRYTKQH